MRYGRRSSDRRGLAICDRHGTVCDASDRVLDKRGGWVRTRDADITPGFGTWHPRDHRKLPPKNDERGIKNARPQPIEYSVQDLGITNASIAAALSHIHDVESDRCPTSDDEGFGLVLLLDDGTPLAFDDGGFLFLEGVI